MMKKALPIWLAGAAEERCCFAEFTVTVPSLRLAEIKLAAAMFYRLFVNGSFVAYGPARTAEGYARVDVISLDAYHTDGENTVTVEVAGFACRSLSTCSQPSFLQAEISVGGDVVCATGYDFSCRRMTERPKTERYSGQRHFGEVYDEGMRTEGAAATEVIEPRPVLIPRAAPYPAYRDVAATLTACGTFAFDETLPYYETRASFRMDPSYWGTVAEEEIPHKPYRWIQRQRQTVTARDVALPVTLGEGEYALFDFGRIECGFLTLTADVADGTDIVIGFSEDSAGEDFAFTNINSQNVVEFLASGAGRRQYRVFEPYTVKDAILMVKRGALTLHAFGLTSYEHETASAYRPTLPDAELTGIYEAALCTFAHNAVDLYTDCPSRERAGWLCDSYFTAKSERFFFGESTVEEAFLENYVLYDTSRGEYPAGILPMCYPSDKQRDEENPKNYIPQWNLWYILEVEEYLRLRAAAPDGERYRRSVEGILSFFDRYVGKDGLLERVPGWNFVEWSDANLWTEDVNYPTNLLYAEALECAYRLYGNEAWHVRAEAIRRLVAERSFDGKLFTDNAVRGEDGALHNTGNTSEACQYYAVLFGDIDLEEEKYAYLRTEILQRFAGAARERALVPVNAFIGLYLRMMALLKLGLWHVLLDDIRYFFGGMAARTGTLWEYREEYGSRDHGFASFAAYAMCTALDALKDT